MGATDTSSTSVVDYNLRILEKAGLIVRHRRKARTIRAVEEKGLEIRIDLPWIPVEEVRGNSSAHYMVKARASSELVERGIEYGLAAKSEYRGIRYPIKGPLAIEITGWNPRHVDWINLAIGYKGFEDGLQEIIKRDQYGDVPGAGLIVDDRQFRDASVKTRIGPARSLIVIRTIAL